MSSESMENLIQMDAPPDEETSPRLQKRRSVPIPELKTSSCSKLQIGSQAFAKDRARRFCFREQFRTFDQTAEVFVGPGKVSYKLHKDVAVAQSPFFAAALKGQFVEGTTGQIYLPEVEPKTFEHVVLWFYTQRLEESNCFFKDGKPTYFTILDIYSVADQLCVEGLRNALVDFMAELADQTNSVPTPMDTNLLYDHIRDNAPMRRLVLDLFAYKKTDNLIATHADAWHPTFLRELVCKLKRPGSSAFGRHDLRHWRSLTWANAKGCDVCKEILKPNVSANICGTCNRTFCCTCVTKWLGDGEATIEWAAAEKECKPWRAARCRCEEYHEHTESEKCECVGAPVSTIW